MTDFEYILEQCRQFNEIFVDEECPNELFMSVNSIASRRSGSEWSARIRGAFVGEFDDYMAKYYYIDGLRGEVKKIALPRDLVVWE